MPLCGPAELLGKRGDNLSILIGRPIALVRARLQLELAEAPATRQLWEDRALPGDPDSLAATKRFTDAEFKVQLGHIDLRDDGTLGFFAPVGGSGSAIDYSEVPGRASETRPEAGRHRVRPAKRRSLRQRDAEDRGRAAARGKLRERDAAGRVRGAVSTRVAEFCHLKPYGSRDDTSPRRSRP